MELTILGSGTGLPRRGHAPAGYLLRIGGLPVLIDMGPGTLMRLEAAGVSYQELEYIFLTHLHADHSLELALLLQNYDSTPAWKRTKPLRLSGCQGLKTFYERLMAAFPGSAPEGYSVELHELGEERLDFGDWSMRAFLTGHTAYSLGYRFEAAGRSVGFTGDAILSRGLFELAQGVDVLVCECSFPDEAPGEGHLTAGQVGRLAQSAGAGRLVLVHLYPPAWEADLLAQVRREYAGPVEIGTDDLSLRLEGG